MPNVKRTPPSKPRLDVQRSFSNSDITEPTSETMSDSEFVNLSKRSTKRPRSECSPQSELKEFKEEIMNMLHKWKKDQDTTLHNFMTKITRELVEIKAQNENLQKIKSEIEESASLMNMKYEEIRSKMVKLENERIEQQEYINKLERKFLDVQENQRSASFELRNIPIKEKEDSLDLLKLVTETGKCLKVDIKSEEIRDVYRTRTKQGPSKLIVVELKSVIQKNNLLQAARDYNKGKTKENKLNSVTIGCSGECVPVYISDRLPPTARQLFYEARKFASANNYQFCWCADGKIFLRKKEGEKIIRILSEKTFLDLLQK